MSHKTGKRVLTASTSLALAVVGLAASPIAAHAATPSVTATNACGAGSDTLVMPMNTGTYTIKTAGSDVTINTDATASTTTNNPASYTLTTTPTVGGTGLVTWSGTGISGTWTLSNLSGGVSTVTGTTGNAPAPSGAVYDDGTGAAGAGTAGLYTSNTTGASAVNNSTYTVPVTVVGAPVLPGTAVRNTTDQTIVYSIPASQDFYVPASTDPSQPLQPAVRVLNSVTGAVVSPVVTNNVPLTGENCDVTSIPAPTARLTTAGGTITVTNGEGVTWTTAVTSGDASLSPTAGTLAFAASATSGTTMDITVTDSSPASPSIITVTATPKTGYNVLAKTWTFVTDGLTAVPWSAPVINDRDGRASDTVTLNNLPGVSYYYKVYSSQTNADAGVSAATTTGGVVANDVTATNTTWTAVPSGAGSVVTITRPSTMAATDVMGIVAFADATHKFSDGNTKETGAASFTDTIKITSIPAPTLVDGSGSADYYILPAVPGVKWTVSMVDSLSNTTSMTYRSGDPRLGQQVPVYTSNPPVAATFTAAADELALDANGVAGNYSVDVTKVTKTVWTQTFDNRASVTPVAPQFVDQTGLVNDAVIWPQLQNGLDGYKYALTTSATAVAPGTFKYADFTWYGKTVSLTDLQRAFSGTPDPTLTKVWITTQANNTTYILAKDASGNAVPASWSYAFTNSVNIIPAAPVQTATGANSYTLTFPVDEKVIYSVTDSNGITRDVAYGDLGKPLPYTGSTVVRARAASSIYTIQPNADGTAPAPWTFLAPSATIKPQAPTMSNPAGTDKDTYTLPAQTGIVWNVNGKDVPLSAYGSPISTGGATTVVVIAQAGAGYALDSTAQAKWTLDFVDGPPTNVQIGNTKDSAASVPTTVFHWSADNATSYDVTYHKTLLNGSAGPEIDWKMDTTDTEAKFVAEPGDEYTVTVVAKNDKGEADAVSSTVKFDNNGQSIIGDVTSGQGTFSAGWNLLGKSQLNGLPYYGDTAALASNGATWTYTVPAGTKSFDLFATVHSLGAKGKIWVNGVNWANFETNPSYWGTVSNPYGYPVRRVQGWDNTKSATITVQQTEGGNLYLALDAYRVNK